jgi:hypothetical protein
MHSIPAQPSNQDQTLFVSEHIRDELTSRQPEEMTMPVCTNMQVLDNSSIWRAPQDISQRCPMWSFTFKYDIRFLMSLPITTFAEFQTAICSRQFISIVSFKCTNSKAI